MKVWMTVIAVGLTVLLPVLIKAQDEPPFPSWGDVLLEETTCEAVQPKVEGDLDHTDYVYKQTQCGSIQKKRRFFETLLTRGKTNQIETRVLGGVEVPKNKWPWLAAIGLKTSGPLCGGTLINDQWILTAAHCMYPEEYPCEWNIRLGEHNFLEKLNHQVDMEAGNLYSYPTFNASILAHDIGMIKLKEPVNITTDPIRPACLARNLDDYEPGTRCFVAGWGNTEYDQPTPTRSVHEIEVTLIDRERCEEHYPGEIGPGMICAQGPENGDHCAGDSGGPLICKNPSSNKWEAIGIISWNEKCGTEGHPGVYTSVSYYMEWIESVLAEGHPPSAISPKHG